jgi:hypothetical protein
MWNSKSSVAVGYFLPGRAKDLSAPLYMPSNSATVYYILRDHVTVFTVQHFNVLVNPPLLRINTTG